MDEKRVARFWARVNKSGPVPEHMPHLGACWLWTHTIATNGYGRIFWGKSLRTTHRLSWELTRGAIPLGGVICHRCDVKHCVNPSHMFVGTQADNLRDMREKGRGVVPKMVGANHANSKLTEADVVEIRRRRAQGETLMSIGAAFGVRFTTIEKVVNRKAWLHVP